MIINHTLDQLTDAYLSKRQFFDNSHTLEYAFRLESLQRLKKHIQEHTDEIFEALKLDLHKPAFEVYTGEIGSLIDEINYCMKNLREWMKPQSVKTPFLLMPSSSKIYSEPKGVVLIIAPWNYPFQLLLMPLVGAIAAGNSAILKPAHETPHTAILLEKIIKSCFKYEHVSVVQGNGAEIGKLLLENFRFDHIFFTGSPNVGKWVMSKAADHLTPVTLELGGKNPTIIDKDVDLEVAVDRITWAKFYNAGQTCLCPDYFLVHSESKEEFVRLLKLKITSFFGDSPEKSPYYARIVNKQRFTEISTYLKQGNILYGGNTIAEENYIEPTVMEIEDSDQEIMKKEIFGPILPIMTWSNKEELLTIIRRNRYPLSCYIYSKNKTLIDFVIQRVEFGGGCINNSMVQYGNMEIPFGGIQTSGLGRYRGRYSFETFSNRKGIVDSPTWFNPDILFAPYTNFKMKVVRFFMG